MSRRIQVDIVADTTELRAELKKAQEIEFPIRPRLRWQTEFERTWNRLNAIFRLR